MSDAIVFDVNETLLDLSGLDAAFEQAFGDASARGAWFSSVLRTALLTTAMDAYADFSTLGAAALDDLAATRDVRLSDEEREAILGGMQRLPAYDDVKPALKRLREAGFRLAALTNSAPEAARAKLEHAGLDRLLDAIFSAADAGRLKPAAAPYRMAAERLGLKTGDICFVAAHDWDVAGARKAGCIGAFVARPGKRLGPLVAEPEITGPDLGRVAERIIEAAGKLG